MWNPFKSTGNEFGEYLPDEKATLETEEHFIEAKNADRAQEKCEQIAQEFGGIKPKARSIDKGKFKCKFGVWR